MIGRLNQVSRGHTLGNLDAGVRMNSDSMHKGKALVGVDNFEEVCREADDTEVVHDCTCGDRGGRHLHC